MGCALCSRKRVLWGWVDEHGLSTFSLQDRDRLESSYASNPVGTCELLINSSCMTVSFRRMEASHARTARIFPVERRVVDYVSDRTAIWEWLNFSDVYMPYSQSDNARIESEFAAGRKTCALKINNTNHVVNFITMQQVNSQTGIPRSVHRTVPRPQSSPPAYHEPTTWDWFSEDLGCFQPYPPADSAAIEGAYRSGVSSYMLVTGGKSYIIDFDNMIQHNAAGMFARKIRRNVPAAGNSTNIFF